MRRRPGLWRRTTGCTRRSWTGSSGNTSATLEQLKRTAETRRKAEVEASQKREAKLNADYQAQWQKLEAEWKKHDSADLRGHRVRERHGGEAVPALGAASPGELDSARRNSRRRRKFAQMEVEVEKLAETTIKDKRLALPGPARFSVPLCLAYPEQGSILFETADQGHDEAIGALNNIILRLLATAPPGPAELHHP